MEIGFLLDQCERMMFELINGVNYVFAWELRENETGYIVLCDRLVGNGFMTFLRMV